jgi:hypothetical protein
VVLAEAATEPLGRLLDRDRGLSRDPLPFVGNRLHATGQISMSSLPALLALIGAG